MKIKNNIKLAVSTLIFDSVFNGCVNPNGTNKYKEG